MDATAKVTTSIKSTESVFKAGYAPVAASKEVPKKLMHTPQQVIAFGGIREYDGRGVRSSGRLSAQPLGCHTDGESDNDRQASVRRCLF